MPKPGPASPPKQKCAAIPYRQPASFKGLSPEACLMVSKGVCKTARYCTVQGCPPDGLQATSGCTGSAWGPLAPARMPFPPLLLPGFPGSCPTSGRHFLHPGLGAGWGARRVLHSSRGRARPPTSCLAPLPSRDWTALMEQILIMNNANKHC